MPTYTVDYTGIERRAGVDALELGFVVTRGGAYDQYFVGCLTGPMLCAARRESIGRSKLEAAAVAFAVDRIRVAYETGFSRPSDPSVAVDLGDLGPDAYRAAALGGLDDARPETTVGTFDG